MSEKIAGIRNIIAVASGKGGVGKSTTCANLALALAAQGARVGILDADIYGPSQPTLMGLAGRTPTLGDDGRMAPLMGYGIQIMSIGFLLDEDSPVIWRGPMVTQALRQLLEQTAWDDVDYLIIDLPPGTGDIHLSIAQRIPVDGAVIVTTPQDIALLDARKGLRMFEKVNIPVLGIVENMSTHRCTCCGHEEPIFGEGGAQRLAAQHGVDVLASLPLDSRIRAAADSGCPTVVATPEGAVAQTYGELARRVTLQLAASRPEQALRSPTLVEE